VRFRTIVVAASVLLVSLTSGLAAAGLISCYTALGYTITCQPKEVDHYDPLGNFIYSFNIGSTATQTTAGSFTWNELRITNGYEVPPHGNLGDAYVFQTNPFSQLLYTRTWFCYPVNQITYTALGTSLYNASANGYWHLYSTSGTDCYMPTP
jgi:hypothetical protein